MSRESGSDDETTDEHAQVPRAPLRIDVSPALHEAGHEVHDLGFEGVPDDGPVLHPERDRDRPADPRGFVAAPLPPD